MSVLRNGRLLLWVAIGVLGSGALYAQTYPTKPIRIVTAPPGGAAELAVRQVAQGIAAGLGQQVIVDHRGGAAGAIAAQTVARMPPDGYTLLGYSSTLWILTYLRANVGFDLAEFSPISLVASSPNVLVVHPSLPATSVGELIRLAKARPGELTYGSGGSGSTLHLSAELFKAMAGVNMLHVPYKSGNLAMIDLLGGRVEVMFPVAAQALPQVKARRLRLLAVTSPEPSPLVPGASTIAASGLRGYASELMVGVFAPAGTPASIIERLNREMVRFLKNPESKEKLLPLGLNPVGTSPEQLLDSVKSEMAKWGKVIKQAGIKTD